MNTKVTAARIILLGSLIAIGALTACTPAEMLRRSVGTSIEALEEEEEGRYAGIVEAGPEDSYVALYDVLDELGVYIYLDRPGNGYVVAMRFDEIFPRCGETTEVGFFFREEEPGATRLEVVCPNRELARFAAERVFSEIDRLEWISMRLQED